MATKKTTHNGKTFTIEMVDSFDFVRNYNYISVYVAIKNEFKRYDVGKATNEEQATAKATAYIMRNF